MDKRIFLKIIIKFLRKYLKSIQVLWNFYQHEIGCNIDRSKALELYLLIVKNKINTNSPNDNCV